jgi:hypothetical protein
VLFLLWLKEKLMLVLLLKLAPGKEFDDVGDVLSLYDKQQLGKLEEGGVMSEAVPEGGP